MKHTITQTFTLMPGGAGPSTWAVFRYANGRIVDAVLASYFLAAWTSAESRNVVFPAQALAELRRRLNEAAEEGLL